MKKLIVTIVALSLFVSVASVFAQTPVTGLVGKGVKVGLNMAKFTGSDAKAMGDQKMKMGLAVGGYITYAFSDLFAVQPELYYTMKGSKFENDVDFNGTLVHVKYTGKYNYIEIPILAKVMLSGTPTFKPNFYAGPGLGFLMSAKVKGEAEGQSAETDVKDDSKSMDLGLIGGVGADYAMGTHKLTFDLRYEAGLSKIGDGSDAGKVYNSAISFLVGFGF